MKQKLPSSEVVIERHEAGFYMAGGLCSAGCHIQPESLTPPGLRVGGMINQRLMKAPGTGLF